MFTHQLPMNAICSFLDDDWKYEIVKFTWMDWMYGKFFDIRWELFNIHAMQEREGKQTREWIVYSLKDNSENNVAKEE